VVEWRGRVRQIPRYRDELGQRTRVPSSTRPRPWFSVSCRSHGPIARHRGSEANADRPHPVPAPAQPTPADRCSL
ncbi:MAG: hypothetical protein AVDCRST_MAG18-2887, partial [uncultured Thermomicrobiales bacterium]